MDVELTARVLAALEREHVSYVVFGAVALAWSTACHGGSRLFIEPGRNNIERLKVALHSVFDDPCIDETTADDLLGEYPAIQHVPPEGLFHLDLLTRLVYTAVQLGG
jgi:hypothetical protein